MGNGPCLSTEGEKMRLGCWKIYECSNCYNVKVSNAKVKSCTNCRTARQKKMMNVISYLFWWVVLACLTQIARAILRYLIGSEQSAFAKLVDPQVVLYWRRQNVAWAWENNGQSCLWASRVVTRGISISLQGSRKQYSINCLWQGRATFADVVAAIFPKNLQKPHATVSKYLRLTFPVEDKEIGSGA